VPSDAAARPCNYLNNVDVEICKRVREIVWYVLRTDFDEPALIQIMLVEDGHVDITRREALSLRVVLGVKMERDLLTWGGFKKIYEQTYKKNCYWRIRMNQDIINLNLQIL
jgi:hypothetical protein